MATLVSSPFATNYETIFDAAQKGTIEDVKHFIEDKGEDVNTKNKYGQTPLHAATGEMNIEVVKFLVSKGAYVNAKDTEGKTPLHLVAYNYNVEIAKFLVSNGAKVNAQNKQGYTPLHFAVLGKSLELVKFLILEANADVKAKGIKYGVTPLHVATSNGKSVEIIKFLVSEGKANINAKDINGSPPLNSAIIAGNIEFAKALISSGADVNVENNKGSTPLTIAEMKGDAAMLQCISSSASLINKKVEDLAKIRKRISKYRSCISAGDTHTVGLKTDGTVVAAGNSDRCPSDWHNIAAIAAAHLYTVGLKADGSIVAKGSYFDYDKDKTRDDYDFNTGKTLARPTIASVYVDDVTKYWRDIVVVAAGLAHIIGLKSNGTVVAIGAKCDYNDKRHSTTDISPVWSWTSDWKNITAIAAGRRHTVGLKINGTVVAFGYVANDQVDSGSSNTHDWRDIVAIAAGGDYTVGLKADGTVVAVGGSIADQYKSWSNIVAIATGGYHIVGLKADSTVVAAGNNEAGQCNTGSWHDIVAIAAGEDYTVGLKTDGTVVAVGNNAAGQCNTRDWRNIGTVDVEQLKRNIEQLKQKESWKKQGLCYNCGGKMEGLIFKKCKLCSAH